MKMTVLVLCITTLLLQACITKVVTVPVKVAYSATKGVVNGTATVVGAVIPDGDDDEKKDD